MKAIHLIERVGNIKPLKSGDLTVFSSESWVVTPQTADMLVGGSIYFHKKQNEPSFFGGNILRWELVPAGRTDAGRVVFIFTPQKELKEVRTTRKGWANEMKIVRD